MTLCRGEARLAHHPRATHWVAPTFLIGPLSQKFVTKLADYTI
jgi:hypothetical protein